MAKMTYAEQLKHPNWQKKRLDVLKEMDFECQSCGDKERTLHVHHIRYVKGRMAWEYENNELKVLCEVCHEREHAEKELFEKVVFSGLSQGASYKTMLSLIAGLLNGDLSIDPDIVDEVMGIHGDPNVYLTGIIASMAGGAAFEKLHSAALSVAPKTKNPVYEWLLNTTATRKAK